MFLGKVICAPLFVSHKFLSFADIGWAPTSSFTCQTPITRKHIPAHVRHWCREKYQRPGQRTSCVSVRACVRACVLVVVFFRNYFASFCRCVGTGNNFRNLLEISTKKIRELLLLVKWKVSRRLQSLQKIAHVTWRFEFEFTLFICLFICLLR